MDRFTKSVASRIILAATFFLILPLVIFMIFMYFHEYRVKSRDAELILQAVATERTLLIEQELALHKEFLDKLEEGASPEIYEKIRMCTKSECQNLIDRAKPIGDDVLLVVGRDRFTVLKELPDGRYATIETDLPSLVEKVQGVPSVSVYLLDEHRDVVVGSEGERELPDRAGRIWVIKPIGAGGYRLLFDIPESVSYGDFFLRTAILIISTILIGGVTVFLLVRRINKPLHQLSTVMQSVGSGDLQARYCEDKMGFEINDLGHVFNQMIGSIQTSIEHEGELRLGREVQHSLLPKSIPELPNLDIATRFIPAKDVGGDFYDLRRLPDGKLCIVMADASGKGIFACLYALITRSLLRAASDAPLATFVQRANEFLCLDSGESSAFVTAWVGLFDPESMMLEYVNCGHNPAICKRASGEMAELTTNGMALGVADFEVKPQSLQLGAGDLLLVYTDGIVEAHNVNNELYGEKRLMEAVTGASSEEVARSVQSSVEAFSQGAPQHDDIALLVLQLATST